MDGRSGPIAAPTASGPQLPCGADTAPWEDVEGRQEWLDRAVNYQVTYRDGEVTGETGPHDVTWGQLIQLTIRSDTGSRLDVVGSGREGIVSQNGTATFAFPAEPTGRTEVVVRETGATILVLDVACP